MVATFQQLSLWPDLFEAPKAGPEDSEPAPTALESEWQDMLRPADRELVTVHNNHKVWHSCGHRLVGDRAITDDGAQAIVICFSCGLYWRVGYDSDGASVIELIRGAKAYYGEWVVRRKARGEL